MGHDDRAVVLIWAEEALDSGGEKFGLMKFQSLDPTQVGKHRWGVLQHSWRQGYRRISPPCVQEAWHRATAFSALWINKKTEFTISRFPELLFKFFWFNSVEIRF